MATDRELKVFQHDKLFDLLELAQAKSEKELREILNRQIAKTESAMTKEEVASVRERVAGLGK